jgi:hypothetical protein
MLRKFWMNWTVMNKKKQAASQPPAQNLLESKTRLYLASLNFQIIL